jgi:hypothetical protein
MTDIAAPPTRVEQCRVCETPTTPFGTAQVLGRIDVQYFQCPTCRFVQTERPYWLAEAYASALIAADVGAVDRSVQLAAITQTVIQSFFRADATFLDYGAGYGLFVRLMRDRGFDFRWYDRYATNLHAVGFEAKPNEHPFELVTAFEVLEHLVDPASELPALLPPTAGALLCTTRLLPSTNPRPGEWWYYALRGGQHVSIYTLAALQRLAARLSCHLASDGDGVHLFSRRPVSERLFRLLRRRRVSALLNAVRRRRSLVESDFARFSGDHLV